MSKYPSLFISKTANTLSPIIPGIPAYYILGTSYIYERGLGNSFIWIIRSGRHILLLIRTKPYEVLQSMGGKLIVCNHL